ncbi:MAG: glycosyltransferase [Saprospiraceae bacterium]|nr:glycosyltransferase [Saprospiraceae bacterium]
MSELDRKNYYQNIAEQSDRLKRKNKFYYRTLERLYTRIIPVGSTVLEIGCGTGDLLNAVRPGKGYGVDFAPKMVEIDKKKYPQFHFICANTSDFSVHDQIDYIIVSDLLSTLWDIQASLRNIRKNVGPDTKIIISSHSYIWEPVLRLAEVLGLKPKRPKASWLTVKDIENLLLLEDFELIKAEKKILFPKYIPVLNTIVNKFIANLPIIDRLGLINMISARPVFSDTDDYSVSVIIPARNEKGNLEKAILRTPEFGRHQEFIFIEGHSQDGTFEEMLRIKENYPDKDIVVLKQTGRGKGNAVREAFAKASSDILMILDADLTTPPEDMPKFYEALAKNKGEFINGCRLVYPMEKQAMQLLNYFANMFFGLFFSYLLGQPLKDTLCGTKVLFKKDYLKIAQNRSYFGEFDPFGDFDLLFGAARLNLKIVEVIVRYKDREYGTTQISRFKHGWLLIKMSFFAARKIKFVS